MRNACLIFVLVATLLGAAPTVAHGGPGERFAQRIAAQAERDDRRERASVSLDDAVAKVRREVGGKVIRAETRYRDGRPVHYVKVLSKSGRVRSVRVDGQTGRLQ